MYAKYFIAAVVGLALGVIGSKILFIGSALSLIPWGLVGLAIGYVGATRWQSLGLGGVYGFTLAFFFMLSGYSGRLPVISRVGPFVVLGIIGAFCGAFLAVVGFLLKRVMAKRPEAG